MQVAVDRTEIAIVELCGYRNNRLLILPPQFIGAAYDVNCAELVERYNPRPRSRPLARCGRTGIGRRVSNRPSTCQTNWQFTEALPIESDAIGIAHSNVGHAILLRNRTGDLTVECGAQLTLHILFGDPDALGF